MATSQIAIAYQEKLPSVPDWLNKGDNAWQLTAATLVGIQSMPGLVILYASIVKKKWAVNSAFMALYAFAAVLICWVLVGYRMAFGDQLLPFWGKGAPALGQNYLLKRARVPESYHTYQGQTEVTAPFYPMASLVYFQFTFAAITLILLAGSVLGRMNIKAWMAFVPLWLIFSYTVGAFSLWGGGFLYHWGVIDYSGGYVIHLSSGISGLTAAYWVGPRLKSDRERFPPNNVLLMLAGAGLLWMGWSGFNGGAPYAANLDASIAVLNTNVCAATSLLVWTTLDVVYFGKPSVIGAGSGHDDRTRLHYSRSRVGAIVGGYSDGNSIRKHSLGVHDDPSQEVYSSSKGGRYSRCVSYTRGGWAFGCDFNGPIGRARALYAHSTRAHKRCILRRKWWRATPEANGCLRSEMTPFTEKKLMLYGEMERDMTREGMAWLHLLHMQRT
ncbi:hypothetical protein Pint_34914 [Pistacia integerrima]|uniref:Uncharacterized protein n=1 Tax=Pistacia integerrima TaxID=434235 RepID=A0ACC0Y1W3_9ROSI|nr:hypothetical protein Pint_34914 [Pistacia integerrima]